MTPFRLACVCLLLRQLLPASTFVFQPAEFILRPGHPSSRWRSPGAHFTGRGLVAEQRAKGSPQRSRTQRHAWYWQVVKCAAATYALWQLRHSFVVIREGERAIVERLGRFSQELSPGLFFLVPFVDVVRARLTTREQVLDIPPQACITSDNAPLSADAVVYWRLVDIKKAVYAVSELVPAIQNLVLTKLRSEIGKLTLDETFSSREGMNSVILQDVDVATDPWGVQVTRVEVRDIIPNEEILSSMELQMAAERTKRAQVIKSEGQKLAVLNEAQGLADARIVEAESEKRASILKAEGEKERLAKEAEGLAAALKIITDSAGGDSERGLRIMLLRAYIDAQAGLASSPSTKVLLFPSARDVSSPDGVLFSELQASAWAGASGPLRQGPLSQQSSPFEDQ